MWEKYVWDLGFQLSKYEELVRWSQPTERGGEGLEQVPFGRPPERPVLPDIDYNYFSIIPRLRAFLAGMWANPLPRKVPAVKPSLAMNL